MRPTVALQILHRDRSHREAGTDAVGEVLLLLGKDPQHFGADSPGTEHDDLELARGL